MRRPAAPAGAAPARGASARTAVTVAFLLTGLLFGTWAARIPAIREQAGASTSQLGLAVAALAVGSLASMPFAGGFAARVGSRRAVRLGLALTCAALALVGQARSLGALCALAFLFGAANAALDVTINAHGITVERHLRRPILSGLHAGFSTGGLVGAGLGALGAAAGVAVGLQLALTAALTAAVGLAWTTRLLPASADAAGVGYPLLTRPPRALWVLGAIAFAGLLVEGAVNDWSAVYLRGPLGASPATAGLGYMAFSAAMVSGRVGGDRVVARVGAVRVVQAGGAVAAVGFLVALLVAEPVVALVGFACLGIGMSGVVPAVVRAAAVRSDLAPGAAVAAVTGIGFTGFLAGPSAIGALTALIGLPTALGLLVVLSAAVAALAVTLR